MAKNNKKNHSQKKPNKTAHSPKTAHAKNAQAKKGSGGVKDLFKKVADKLKGKPEPKSSSKPEAKKTSTKAAAPQKEKSAGDKGPKSLKLKAFDSAKADKINKIVEKEKLAKATQAAAAEKTKKKGKKGPEKEELELEDDFVADDIGGNEIEEYEDELRAVEETDEEIEEIETEVTVVVEKSEDEEIILTDAEGRRYCRARDCDQAAAVDLYCRYHYLLFWKKIQVRKKILMDGKLERYVVELTGRYPDKFLEMIWRDLRTEKDFVSAIQELEIDESNPENEFEEDTQSFIDEVRGMSDTGAVDEEEY